MTPTDPIPDLLPCRDDEYTPNLLPCPFCGGEAKLIEPDGIWYAVACTKCHIQGTGNRNQDYKAVNQWNTRAESARHQPKINA